jgi:hypothetical protein
MSEKARSRLHSCITALRSRARLTKQGEDVERPDLRRVNSKAVVHVEVLRIKISGLVNMLKGKQRSMLAASPCHAERIMGASTHEGLAN